MSESARILPPKGTLLAPGIWFDPGTRRASIDPGDPVFYGNPYAAYAALRAATPAFYWEQQRMWCFLGAADISSALRDRRFGREAPGGEPAPAAAEAMPAFAAFQRHSLLEREPPVHTRLRTLVSRAFVTRSIERLQPRIAALAHRLLDPLIPAGGTELLSAFATPIPVTVIAELLGVPTAMAPQLLDWSHRMVAVYQLVRTAEMEAEAESATHAFSAYLREYAGQRRRQPADDLISHLVEAEASGERLNEDELIATCILLLNAGHEATVHTLGNAVKTLLEHGTNLAAAFASPEATAATVEECLRFDPPLHLFTRYASEDLELAGVSIARGDQVGLLYGAGNRDPARFTDPDCFNPQRPPAPHLSFGGGIHFCLGAALARLELETALPILASRLPRLRFAQTPVYRNSYHFHGLAALHVAWG